MKNLDQLQQVFDALPYPVFAKNAQHQWIYGNAAFEELIGHTDYIGKDDRAYFPPEQVKAFRTADRRVGLPLSSGPPDLLARRFQGSSVHAATSP